MRACASNRCTRIATYTLTVTLTTCLQIVSGSTCIRRAAAITSVVAHQRVYKHGRSGRSRVTVASIITPRFRVHSVLMRLTALTTSTTNLGRSRRHRLLVLPPTMLALPTFSVLGVAYALALLLHERPLRRRAGSA